MTEKEKKRTQSKQAKEANDLYMLRRKLQREKRDLRKKALGIQDDHTDTSLQRNYGIATKTKRALKVEMFNSLSKKSATSGEETSIEKFVKDFLLEKNIKFIEQKCIEYINVDFFLCDYNLAIEVMGDYWHCNFLIYPVPKNNVQKKNIEKDKRTREILERNKKNLLVLWENEINNNPDLVKKNLERIIAGDIKLFEESGEWK